MPQNAVQMAVSCGPLGNRVPLLVDRNNATLVTSGGNKSRLSISTNSTVVSATHGRVCRVSVLVAGTTAGAIHDSAVTTGLSDANKLFTVPMAIGVYTLDWVVDNGIVCVPGTGQTISIAYL